jgi:hypothetical protein
MDSFIIVLIIYGVCILLCVLVAIKNNMVFKFRTKVLKLEGEYSRKLAKTGVYAFFPIYDSMPSYNKMLFFI